MVKEAGDEIASKTAAKTEVNAKIRCPWLTGRLCRSIRSEKIAPGEYKTGTDVDYGPYVEMGTSRMRAQPYLRPAAEEAIAAMPPEIQQILEAKIKIRR